VSFVACPVRRRAGGSLLALKSSKQRPAEASSSIITFARLLNVRFLIAANSYIQAAERRTLSFVDLLCLDCLAPLRAARQRTSQPASHFGCFIARSLVACSPSLLASQRALGGRERERETANASLAVSWSCCYEKTSTLTTEFGLRGTVVFFR